MAIKVKNGGKAFLAIAVLAGIFCAKIFWWDKRPHEVQASTNYGKVAIPDAPEASLTGTAAVKLPFPETGTYSGSDATQITAYVMAWQSQNSFVYANGGKNTTKGSLFAGSNLEVTITRQDNCTQSCTDLAKFCKEYKDNPKTPGVLVCYMASGTASYLTNLANLTKDLGPEYQPIAFMSTGKSYGEDQIIGDVMYKNDKQKLKGAVLVGVRLDGDNDLALKLCGDNNIDINVDETTYDYDALNMMYPADFLDAAVKYNTGYTETRHIVRSYKDKNGKKVVETTGRDTVISANLCATWTPGDVNVHNGKGGVTIVSTKEWPSIMPNIWITCKKWLNDHRTAVEEITKDCAIAGDQIRSFEDVKKYAADLNKDVYNDATIDWYTLYKGKSVDENTHLGGSMVFNLADMANIFGVYIEGQTDHNDIYRAVYNTFGTLQSKYYPKDLPTYLDYSKAMDKSVLTTVISNNPDLLKGKVNLPDYSVSMTNKLGNKSYHIEFETGSAVIKSSSQYIIDQIFQDAVAADGTKVKITGYTDNTGDPGKNQALSEQRAQSVLNALREKGLGTSRLSSDGQGPANPIASNTTAEGRAQNRRVEITILGQ